MHAIITITAAQQAQANVDALQFGEGTTFNVPLFAASAPDDSQVAGYIASPEFQDLHKLAAVQALVATKYPGATLTTYDLIGGESSPLPAVLATQHLRTALPPPH